MCCLAGLPPLPSQLPCQSELHKYFMSAALLDAAELSQERAQPDGTSDVHWPLKTTKYAYLAAIVQHGSDANSLSAIITAVASAILRVSQWMNASTSECMLRHVHRRIKEAHLIVQNHNRDQQLLAIAHSALDLQLDRQVQQPTQQPQSWHWALQQCSDIQDIAGLL